MIFLAAWAPGTLAANDGAFAAMLTAKITYQCTVLAPQTSNAAAVNALPTLATVRAKLWLTVPAPAAFIAIIICAVTARFFTIQAK